MDIPSIEQKLPKLVILLWDELVGQLWLKRNDILHRSANYVTEQTQLQLGDRLLWYLQHKEELSRRDQDLIRFTPAQIDAMTITQRQEWVRHLDIAREEWTNEKPLLLQDNNLSHNFSGLNQDEMLNSKPFSPAPKQKA